jgi:hypothetical protein
MSKIGAADFGAMNVLDADDNPLSYGNKRMTVRSIERVLYLMIFIRLARHSSIRPF